MIAYQKFITEVTNGKIISNKYVKLAVTRHKKDLKRKDIYFDSTAADAAIEWIEALVIGNEFKDIGGQIVEIQKKLILSPFQAFIIASLFGWKTTKTKRRRFKYSYIEMAKGGGKTTLEAAIALLFLHLSDRAEVYSSATKRDQAKIAFRTAQSMVRNSPHVRAEAMEHSIFIRDRFSTFTALSSDANTLDGLAPDFVIVDEYHAHPNDELYNNLKSAMGKKYGSHLSVITTAGFNKMAPCYRLRQSCIDLLEGKIQDDTTFTIIFTLDPKDNWEDPKVWGKANPNLNVTIDLDWLLTEYNHATNLGASAIVNFQTKNLNIWTDASAVWIPDKLWMKNYHRIKMEELEGVPCFGGLDFASGIDLNAFTLVFPEVNGKMAILCWFWVPEENVKNNRDRNDYSDWVAHDYIRTTPGSVIEPDVMVNDIIEICKKYNVQSMAYDRKLAIHGIVQDLSREGYELHEIAQVTSFLSEPTKELERLATAKLLEHFGNPVLRWMIGNVEIKKDTNANIRIDRDKSKNKIDGVAATINALADYMKSREEDTQQAGMFVI